MSGRPNTQSVRDSGRAGRPGVQAWVASPSPRRVVRNIPDRAYLSLFPILARARVCVWLPKLHSPGRVNRRSWDRSPYPWPEDSLRSAEPVLRLGSPVSVGVTPMR